MAIFGLRSMVKDGVRRLLGREQGEAPAPAPTPIRAAAPVAAPPPVATAPTSDETSTPSPAPAAPVEPPAPTATAAAVEPAPVAAATPARVPAEDDDTAGPPILFDDVQALLDDMVRPALQGDGGDITLIKVEQRKIFVRLVGACSTCPSSIMTMKMGVEALLKEEFPQMEELVQVEA